MSDAKRQIGRLLTDRLSDLPEDITERFVCGCFPEDMRIHDGLVWAYTRELGFHSPFEPHPTDEQLAARWFLTGAGEGGAC